MHQIIIHLSPVGVLPQPEVRPCKKIALSGVNWRNFYATILKFFVIFDHSFSRYFIFGNMFPESRFRCCVGHKVK